MKNATFLILVMSIFPLVASAAKGDVTPGLNQCAAVMDSKVYVSTDFHAYPRDVEFDCSYKCNSNGKIDLIKGRTKVTVSNMDQDARDTVCQGLQMKVVPWGYDFDKIASFYAPDTEIVAIKKWAFKNNDFNPSTNPMEKARLEKLKQDLYQISSSLIVAGMNGSNGSYIKEAGIRVSEIADALPMNTLLLEDMIKEIVGDESCERANFLNV